MGTKSVMGQGDINSPSVRVGKAWRQLGDHARSFHRDELARDIAVLRTPDGVDGRPATPPTWRWNPVRRQQLKVLAATY